MTNFITILSHFMVSGTIYYPPSSSFHYRADQCRQLERQQCYRRLGSKQGSNNNDRSVSPPPFLRLTSKIPRWKFVIPRAAHKICPPNISRIIRWWCWIRYTCPKCARSYRHLHHMLRHCKFECGSPPRFQCPYCGMRSKQSNNVYKHIRIKHPGSKLEIVVLHYDQLWNLFLSSLFLSFSLSLCLFFVSVHRQTIG